MQYPYLTIISDGTLFITLVWADREPASVEAKIDLVYEDKRLKIIELFL